MELLAVFEGQGIKIDVVFIKDEFEDASGRWNALSFASRDLLKSAKKEHHRHIAEEEPSLEEAIVEAQIVETEAEPFNWEMMLSDPTYAAKIEVRKSRLFKCRL